MSSQVLITNEVFTTTQIDGIEDSNKLIEKTRKLLKNLKLFRLRNSKDEKLFKSQNLAKSRKKLSKNGNTPNFNSKKIYQASELLKLEQFLTVYG